MTRRYTGGFLSATEQVTDANTANGIFSVQDAGALTAAGSFPTGRWTPQRSIRFRRANKGYFSRTPGTAGNRRTWTWSAWVKQTNLTNGAQPYFTASNDYANGTYSTTIYYNGSSFKTRSYEASTEVFALETTAQYRDPSAWYHLVISVDTTHAIASERVKMYVNGVQQTAFDQATYPSTINYDTYVNSTAPHRIGSYPYGAGFDDQYYMDGYMTEYNLIDGQALTPYAFGFTDPETGTWVPKRYTGSYGTNGFYLDFRDNSASTAAAIGADRSGNGNNWTPNIISLTAGTTYDSSVDVPGIAAVSSQPDIGGVQRGNYPTFNPLSKGSSITLSESNSYAYNNSSASYQVVWTTQAIPPSGKYYWEFTLAGAGDVFSAGIAPVSMSSVVSGNIANQVGKSPSAYSNYSGSAGLYCGPGYSNALSAAADDVLNFAYDADTGRIWIGKNGTFYAPIGGTNTSTAHGSTIVGSGIPSDVVDAQWRQEGMIPYMMAYNGTGTGTRGGRYNFGQRQFAYTPPAGFKSFCTTTIPTPVIKRPSDHFDVKTYTGNGTNLTVGTTAKEVSTFSTSSLEFKPEQFSYALRTPAVTGSQTTATYSFWLKRAVISANHPFHTTKIGSAGTNATVLQFRDNNKLDITFASTGDTNYGNQTSRLFTDTTSWYHVVVAVDTTQVSDLNRLKVYVNGVQVFSWDTSSIPPLNATLRLSNSSLPFNIGADPRDGTYFNGSISEAYFIDGQALTASSFGQFDANNNWMPQRYTGTYGTNGFYLPFSKPSNVDTMSYAGSFNGSNQYLQATLPATLSGAFTIEAYVYRNSAINGAIFTIGDSNTSTGLELYIGTTGTLYQVYSSGSQISLSSPTGAVPNVGGWSHVAVTRDSSNVVRMFVDGKQAGSTWTTAAAFSTAVRIGVEYYNATLNSNYFNGYISNFRIVNGTALYTSTTYTPPTSALTAVANTALLTLQSATVVDNSTNALSITNNNTVTISDASPWQRTVGYDASGSNNNFNTVNFDYSVPRSTVLTYGTPGTYTWVAPTGVTSVKALVIAGGGAGGTNGGGGGAGGMIYNAAVSVTPGSSYTVTVGRGGFTNNKGNATNSVFSSLTAIAGGNGCTYSVVAAQSGGSGGGGMLNSNAGGAGTAGQGYAGGTGNNGNSGNTYYGAGGGGAGGVGYNGGDSRGGPGLLNSITGVPLYYAGGGGGNYFITNTAYRAAGGIGGGGSGENGKHGPAAGGRPNTGGGGGATTVGLGGGPGGSGVVILSYTNASLYDGVGANSIIASDISKDAPTDSEDSTGVSGNYPILNYANYNISNSNSGNTYNITNAGLTLASDDSGAHKIVPATMPISSGKWYFEMIIERTASDAYASMGLIPWPLPNHTYLTNLPSSVSGTNGFSWQSGTANNLTLWTNYDSTYRYVTMNPITASAIGDVMQIAIDIDNSKIWAGRNNTWYDASGGSTGNPSTGANPTATNVNRYIGEYGALIPFVAVGSNNVVTANFGQTGFMYTPPTGFKSINSKNLKDVGSNNLPDSFGNFVNTPDLVWMKSRTSAYRHQLLDTVRGPRNCLFSSDNTAQQTYESVQSFIPNGVVLGTEAGTNTSGDKHVGWFWNKGKTPGFDIVNYAANGATQSISHNLGVAPKFMIIKDTTSAENWQVYHDSIGPQYNIYLNTVGGTVGPSSTYWGGTSPTSTHFTVGSWQTADTHIAYLWAEVPGFSKFGSYTGNNANDGPFVYLGFRPRFILLKKSGEASTTYGWQIYDTARSPINVANLPGLWADTTAAEAPNTYAIDLVSNGFKLKTNNLNLNNTSTFIYAAFAETPFKYANAR